MDFTIRIDVTPELLNAINRMADAVIRLIAAPAIIVKQEAEPVAEPAPQAEPAAETESISLEIFRKSLGEISRRSPAVKEQVKGILKTHGYDKAVDVRPEDRRMIMDEVAAL